MRINEYANIDERIKAIMASVLGVMPDEINDKSSPRSIEAWKGVNHRRLIEELEMEFNITFDASEIETFVNYKIIRSTIIASLN